MFLQRLTVNEFLRDFFGFEQLMPFYSDVLRIGIVAAIPIDMHHDVMVIRHHTKCRDVNIEDGSQPE